MKLTKISLAALVALGAFSSVASATPLEEAIKNVDLSGHARYRYTSDKGKNYESTPAKEHTSAKHEFRMVTNFKAAIDDNFFGVLGLRYQADDTSGNRDAKTDTTNTTGSFGVREFYLGYKYENTTITAGKQLISTYFDEDVFGTGVKIMNKDIPGITLMAAAFDALAIGGSTGDPDVDGVLLKSGGLDSLNKSSNLYAIGAMGSFDPVAFKIWYANLHEVANLFAGDAALNLNINDVKLNLQAQYAHNDVDSDQSKYTDANFYGVKAGVGAFGASFDAGYVNYKADDAKGGAVGTSFVALENSGKLIKPGKILNGVISGFYTNIKDKNDYWFVNAKYVYDKFGIGAGYTAGKGYGYMLSGTDVTRAKRNEWYGQLDYKYSKKLNFMTWYAAAKEKKDGKTAKMDRIRFEAKYSF
ncbi:major outer membrane protein [Campylobacter curvus]|uniref:major outer membrane protein n=1 Tax=Campylobacter curvus TaxID=200 RepID=UPI00147026F1|nr:major outer membrane protein [Campylobacter curvus]